jgi:hypothetical protein|tara:strand:- start:3302 stop:3466 length:165 start_codon:yes stop_codon:yes gene_type:complete
MTFRHFPEKSVFVIIFPEKKSMALGHFPEKMTTNGFVYSLVFMSNLVLLLMPMF